MSLLRAWRAPSRGLRRLYDWTLGWANTRWGEPALFLLALVEASFFIVPPDLLLMALALSRPERAFRYALICTAGSVIGGVLGWGIGVGLWRSLGIHAGCPEFDPPHGHRLHVCAEGCARWVAPSWTWPARYCRWIRQRPARADTD